jgi:hypothetical protein
LDEDHKAIAVPSSIYNRKAREFPKRFDGIAVCETGFLISGIVGGISTGLSRFHVAQLLA